MKRQRAARESVPPFFVGAAGMRIATVSVRTGCGNDRVTQEVRWGGQRRPPLRNDKRRGWSWHAVYAYIRIYTIYTRKSLAEFAARRRQKNSNHFSPRHVRGEKYLSGCQCGILPLAAKLCAQQTANPFGRKNEVFSPAKEISSCLSYHGQEDIYNIQYAYFALLVATTLTPVPHTSGIITSPAAMGSRARAVFRA